MKIVYLTWGETPRAYGVFASQVLGQFIETKKIMPEDEFHFISAVPIIHSGLVREKLGYLKELKNVKKLLGDINFSMLPIFAPQNFVNSSANTFKFMHLFSHYLLKNKLVDIGADVVHCRSYHAAWAALKVKEKYNLPYKVIFDARGLWPEEVSLKKGYSDSSDNYKFLKTIESYNFQYSSVIVAVSDTMSEIFKNIGAKKVKTIYLSSNTGVLKNTNLKNEKNNSVTFCYVGALSESTWHKPKELLSLYQHLRNIVTNPKLMIVTTSNYNDIKECFADIPNNELVFSSTKNITELKEKLIQADIGLMSYFTPVTSREVILGKTVLAVKTAEYLAAGLPMIVNSYCGGAAKIITEHGIGLAYNPNDLTYLTSENVSDLLLFDSKLKAQEKSYDLFDYRRNAERYKSIYQEITR